MGAKVTVLGAGSWGTALAVHLGRVGHDVRLWARDAGFATTLSAARENAVYLPGVPFPPSLTPNGDLAQACAGSEMVVFVCPSSGVRPLAESLRTALRHEPVVVSAAKG